MMTVSLREALSSKRPISLAALRSGLLLFLLSLFATSAFAQSLLPGGPVPFGSVNVGQSSSSNFFLTFTAPGGGTDITGISAVTEGVSGKDFAVTPGSTCLGVLTGHQSCKIYLTFTPQQIGLRLGALTITDSAGTIVNLVSLYGVGVGPQAVFQPATASAIATDPGVGSFTPGTAIQDPNGNIIFLDIANNRILEESQPTPPAAPVFTQIYPIPPLPAAASILTLGPTSGLTIDGSGTLYISSGSTIYALPSPYNASALLPIPITGAPVTAAAGLAVDPFGDLYIAYPAANAVYELGGDVSGGVAVSGGSASALALPGLTAPPTLSGPTGLFIDENLTLYIADTGNNRIVEVPLVGSPTATSFKPTSIALSGPTGIAVDPAGTLYIADTGNGQIVEATALGDQFILSAVPAFTLHAPSAVLVEASGNLVVSDPNLPGLVTYVRTTTSVNFPTLTEVGTFDTADDPETLTVQGTGNIASTLSPSFSGANPTAFPLVSSNPPSTCLGGLSMGQVCVYDLNFDPTVIGLNKANIIVTATAGSATPSSNSATLTGNAYTTLKSFSLVAIDSAGTTPTTVNLGGSVKLVLTALNSDGTIATDYVGNITFTTSDPNGDYLGGTHPNTNTSVYTMTLADNGVLTIPLPAGLQLNDYGVFTATATADPTTVPSGANGTAISNSIYVNEPSNLLNLQSSQNPSSVNQSVTFTLTVAPTGGVTPTGTVYFYNNGVQIGSPVPLTNGVATSAPDIFTVSGSHPITATFTSTSSTPGGAASLTQVVGITTATLTSSVNPVAVGATTTLTATVHSTTGTPNGTVTFSSKSPAGVTTVLGTGNLVGGIATLNNVSFPAPGQYILTASYTDAFNQLVTATYIETVLNAVTISLSSSVNPLFLDNNTILTATLTPAVAGAPPTGTVSFFDGTTPIGSGAILNGAVSITVSFVYAGTHNLTAVYSGLPGAFAPATSPVYAQTVADFTLTVAAGGSSSASTLAGNTATYALVVTPIITTTFPGPITLTVTGLPASVTGVLTPSTIAAGSGTTNVALATTAASLLQAARLHHPPVHPTANRSPLRYAPVTLALLALPLAWFRRRKRFAPLLASMLLLLALSAGLSGCVSAANTGYYGETPKTYNLTVTATSGPLSRSTYLTLTVQ